MRSHNFSQAFERMCSVVAIADTRTGDDTLKQLILQCFVVGSDRRFYSSEQIRDQIQAMFGLNVPQHQVDQIFLSMVREGNIELAENTHYVLPARIRTDLEARIRDATALEEQVKAGWLSEITESHVALDGENTWIALRDYLAKAFGRHGLLTVALLDPTIDASAEQDTTLITLLNDVVNTSFPAVQRNDVRSAITGFLNSVVDRQDRAKYIAQLADGAFNYYSLTVAPDVSERLRENLSTLTLFLDTNFLLGILDLHTHSLVEISHQLLHDIDKHKLPFKLRFHPATADEMRATLEYYGRRLRLREWPPALSKLVLERIATISGIERKYHQVNSQGKTSVDAFLQPYQRHSDVLLREKNIYVYRSRLVEEDVNTLCYSYREFVTGKRNGRETKEDATIRHDMTVLDTVRQLRSNAKSSLQAGALLLTCDATLCRFDWTSSRTTNRPVCTILPDILWQMLRPFLLDGQAADRSAYDRAFAATFAIPEFRAIENSAAREKAKERLIDLLAQYRDVSEATATKLITNDLLLTQLESDMTDEEAHVQLESELLQANAHLLEEAAALQMRLELEQQEREMVVRQLQEARAAQETTFKEQQATQAALRKEQIERAAAEHTRSEEQTTLRSQLEEEREAQEVELRRQRDEAEEALEIKEQELQRKTREADVRVHEVEAQGQARASDNARQIAELKARLDGKDREDIQRRDQEAERTRVLAFYRDGTIATALSALFIVVFLLLVYQSTLPPFIFIRKHPHTLGLQFAGIVAICCVVFACKLERWRGWCIGVGILSLCGGGLMQIL